MVVNDNARNLDKRGALESIAGKPAPTGGREPDKTGALGFIAGRYCVICVLANEHGHHAVVITGDGIANDRWSRTHFIQERCLQFTHFRVRRITSAGSVPA
jgi:hypothetical protein